MAAEPAISREPPEGAGVRVLLLVNSLVSAGAELSLRALQTPLAERGIDTRLATLTAVGVGAGDRDIDVLGEAYPGRRRAVARARRAVRRHRPDLVHTTLFEADLVGRVAARLEHVPAVSSLVSTPYVAAARATEPVSPVKLRATQALDQLLARRATSAFHAISETVADAAVRGLRVPRDRITVVPRGRDAARLGEPTAARRETVRAALGIPRRVAFVVAVGREEPQKNHATLVEAVARLRARRDGVVLGIAGRRGRATPDIDAAVRGNGLPPEAVRRLGPRGDVPDLLSAADVFAFPSRWEGLGGAAIEAMALHTPIVAGDVPALRELLADGDAGLLADPADPAALAGALERTLAEPEETAQRAARAGKRFQVHYTLEASAAGMAAFYRAAAGRA
jgi:glycosyltransferase involved in cell wall biosynthesis